MQGTEQMDPAHNHSTAASLDSGESHPAPSTRANPLRKASAKSSNQWSHLSPATKSRRQRPWSPVADLSPSFASTPHPHPYPIMPPGTQSHTPYPGPFL